MDTALQPALIAFGSNQGDSNAILDQAKTRIAALDDVQWLVASQPYHTPPVGGAPDQPGYVNAVWKIATTLAPQALLARLREVEQALGRERTLRWGPRTADLDLLLLGEQVVRTPELTLPHPRMSFRRFVLQPAVEVAADFLHPTIGVSLGDLLDCLDHRPNRIGWLLPSSWNDRMELAGWSDALIDRHPDWAIKKIFSEKDFLKNSDRLKLAVRFPEPPGGQAEASEGVPWTLSGGWFSGPTLELNTTEHLIDELNAAIEGMLPFPGSSGH